MRLRRPRLEPLPESEWSDELRAVLEPLAGGRSRVLNIFATLGHHPALLRRWLVFGNHVLAKSTLPPREREMAILRIGWLCQAEYEWGQHVLIARGSGVTDDEIKRIAAGPDAGFGPADRAILQAADELHADAMLGDDTWKALNQHLTTEQILDLVFCIGQYNLVSMALNTLGVQRDEGVPGFAETT